MIRGAGRALAATALVALTVGVVGGFGAAASDAYPAVRISTAPGERLAFEPAETTVSGVRPLTIVFNNVSALAHNLVFVRGADASTRTIVAPGTSDALSIDVASAGRYEFVCTIHQGMAGAIVVEDLASGS